MNATTLRTLAAAIVLCTAVACSESPEKTADTTDKPVAAPAIQPDKPDIPARQPIVAWIEAEPEEGEAPLKVQLTAMLKGGTPPYSVRWVFGDETPDSAELTPVHTYPAPGVYAIELYAKDSTGDDDEDDIDVIVE